MTNSKFEAPWGALLWVFTSLGCVVVVGGFAAVAMNAAMPPPARLTLCTVFAVTLIGCALTAVRGYRLEDGALVIERLGWEKRVPLAGLRAATHDKSLLDGALRVGNGGLFAFAGMFWSRKLGWFHLVGNDILGRPVLLEFADQKWLVTPDDPERFIAELRLPTNT